MASMEDYDAHVPRIWLRGNRLWLRLAYHIYNTSATKRNQNGFGRRPFYDMWQARHTVTKVLFCPIMTYGLGERPSYLSLSAGGSEIAT